MSISVGVTSSTPLRVRVAEEVRVALARKRMSAAKLGRALGVSQTYVWRRLNGETAFDLDDLERIAAILGVEIGSLLPSLASQISDAPTVRYAQPTERPPRPSSARPADNRPKGRPRVDLTPGVTRTTRLPRPPQRKAA